VLLSFLQRASRFEEDIKNHQKGKRVLWKEHFQHGTPCVNRVREQANKPANKQVSQI
jgi:hypothetical protein